MAEKVWRSWGVVAIVLIIKKGSRPAPLKSLSRELPSVVKLQRKLNQPRTSVVGSRC